MKILGKDGILYYALAIVIAVLAPIVAVICVLVAGAISTVRKLITGR